MPPIKKTVIFDFMSKPPPHLCPKCRNECVEIVFTLRLKNESDKEFAPYVAVWYRCEACGERTVSCADIINVYIK